MRRYYWAAKAVTQLNDVLLQNIEALLFPQESKTTHPIPGDGNEYFIERQGVLDITDPQLFQKHPEQILRTFLVFAQTASVKSLSATIFRALYNARSKMDAKWRTNPINRSLFIEILKQPQGVSRAFHLMNRSSVLGRYLPAFRKIVGQMQHDLFHVYTVDQHILTVVRNLRRFIAEDGSKGKVTLRFRGREITHQEFGMRLLERIRDELSDVAVVEHMPRLEGRQMVMVLAPKKKK